MNRNMNKSRNREQRTKPVNGEMVRITLRLNREDHERMKEVMRDSKYDREDIFRVGLDHLSA